MTGIRGSATGGPASDRWLVDGLLTELGQRRWEPRNGDLLEVGDPEVQLALAPASDHHRVDRISRGVRQAVARFGDSDAAYRYLVLTLAEDLRSHRSWPEIRHRRLAPRTRLTDGLDGQRLVWPAGWALFGPGRFGGLAALPFSWAVSVRPEEIVESYGHLNGDPLFDLGITDPRPWTEPAPAVSTLRPRPVETPPPDPAASTELETVATAVAELGWTVLPPSEAADLLALGESDVGRVISYRHGMVAYQSFVRDQRRIVATFSTTAAARRFLIMDVGAIGRTRRRQPILRVRRPAAGWTATRGPTELTVDGDDLRATFPLGPIGQQNAFAFTYCARAALSEITHSHHDPVGSPLFPG